MSKHLIKVQFLTLKTSLAILVILHLNAVEAFARTSYSISQCVLIALENNLDKKSEELGALSVGLKKNVIESEMGFKVEVGAYGKRETFSTIDSSKVDTYDDFRARAKVSKVLFSNALTSHKLQMWEYENLITQKEAQLSDKEIILNTRLQYWRVATLQKIIEINSRKIERLKVILDLVKAKVESGFAKRLDVQWAEVQLGLAHDDSAVYSKDYDLSVLTLKNLMGVRVGDDLDLSTEMSSDVNQDLEYEYEQGNDTYLQIADIKISEEIERKNYISKELRPVINFDITLNDEDGESNSLSFNTDWNAAFTRLEPISYDIPIFYEDNLFIGFNVIYPLFDGGVIRERLKVADVLIEKIKNNKKIIKQKREYEVLKSRKEYETIFPRLAKLLEVQMVAKQNVQAAKIGYENGFTTLTELVEMQSALSESEIKYREALYEFYYAKELLHFNLMIKDYYSEER